MPVSRRLRFEVLRRDGYTCRYCGAKAPDVALTVDHIIPTTLGGDDDPRNLVTACTQCNAGKSSIAPDSPIVEDVDATAMLFAGAIDRAAAQRRADRAAIEAVVVGFDEEWQSYKTGYGREVPRESGWQGAVERFYGLGLTHEDLTHFIKVAMRSRADLGAVWRYFCGCCWRELTTRQEMARQMIEDGDV
jgi:hypothetical protein